MTNIGSTAKLQSNPAVSRSAAQEETKDLYSVIDLLADKVERQLKKHVEKTQARKVRSRSTGELLTAVEERELQSRPGRA